MKHPWRPLPDGLGHVRLEGLRPALRTDTGEFLRLHRVPDGGRLARRAYLRQVTDFARDRRGRIQAGLWPAGRRRVDVLDTDQLSRAIADQLARLGADVRRSPRSAADATADLVVAVAAHAPEPAVADRLADLPSQGTAVLHGHADGGGFLVMPLATDRDAVTPDQVRRRRLAASPAADELACWLTQGPPVQPSGTVRALVTARVVEVVRTWASEAPQLDDLRRTLHVVHPDLHQTQHVVLGFDEPAPTTAPPR
ncbi:hypothetical protein GCM10009821_23280 [Aeromicrobium halocynthiae]|uniref:Uncharacterized protein n=1 Tax=Aeromicrobium halocynthiae TaxID=560557 RepID=A0ABN2W2U6_9ACTN